MMRRLLALAVLVGWLLALAACAGDAETAEQQPQPQAAPEQPSAGQADGDGQPGEPLRIGFLVDFTSDGAEWGAAMLQGFELAIQHLNEAGGVFGQPVEAVVGDTRQDPATAVEEARRLIEIEGVHAIVGAFASAMSLPIAESVTGPAGIPQISPSATSPQLTLAADDDFLFRTILSNIADGSALADLTRELGFDNVGLIYRNDAWGLGLAQAFESHWSGGTLTVVSVEPRQPSYLSELQQSAANGAEVLVVVTFPPEGEIILREAIEHELYDQFTFTDASQSLKLIEAIGAEHLAGMRGTAPAARPASESSEAWEAAMIAEYGEITILPWVKESYDATIALALAAQAAGSTDGAAIRDQLRAIGAAPGQVVIPSIESLRSGLRLLAEGGEVDFEGAAATLDWDEHGDLSRGFIAIWQFTEDESFEEIELMPWERQP